jgi:hypothetical protein
VPQNPVFRHEQDNGWDAVEFDGVGNGWGRDLWITDSDNAITTARSSFLTFTDITIDATRKLCDSLYQNNIRSMVCVASACSMSTASCEHIQ